MSKLSSLERQIIGELIKDPRKNISDISKTINSTRLTISKKVKKLLGSKEIAIAVTLNLNIVPNVFYLLRIQFKQFEKVDAITELLKKCPKVMSISHTVLNQELLITLFDEKVPEMKNGSFSCMHLVESLQKKPYIENCAIEKMFHAIQPTHLVLDNHLLQKSEGTPCGRYCDGCTDYMSKCVGCPATSLYNGKLKFG